MRVTSSNIKPEVLLSHCCRHLEIVYNVVTPYQVARYGRNLVAWCRISRWLLWCGWNSNRKKNSNMADVCFPNRKYLYLSRKFRYVVEIWFVDKFLTSEEFNDIKYKTESSTAPQRLPSWNCILRHNSAADADYHAYYCDLVKLAKGRIPIWRTFVYSNRK